MSSFLSIINRTKSHVLYNKLKISIGIFMFCACACACFFGVNASATVTSLDIPDITSSDMPYRFYSSEKLKDKFFYVYNDKTTGNAVFMKYDLNNSAFTQVCNQEGLSLSYSFKSGSDLYFLKSNSFVENYVKDDLAIAMYKVDIYKFDMKTETLSLAYSLQKAPVSYFFITDDNRACISSYKGSFIYDLNDGELLNVVTYDSATFSGFVGYDSSNGNAYYISSTNWVYWGYDHYMTSLNVLNLNKNNNIRLGANELTIQYQTGFFNHYDCAEFWESGYLADLSTFSGNVVHILDSSKINIDNLTTTQTTIYLDGGLSVSSVNLKDAEEVTKLSAVTRASKYENNKDITSVGSRTTYLNDRNSVFISSDELTIDEYSLDTKKKTASLQADYPVYKLMNVGGGIVAIERDSEGAFYVEKIGTSYADSIKLSGPEAMNVGDSGKISVSFGEGMKQDYTYTSSDKRIVSVNKKGTLAAFNAGEATITVTTDDGRLSDSITITVTGEAKAKTLPDINTLTGFVTGNTGYVGNYTYGMTVSSYLENLDDGGVMRVENIKNEYVLVEYYDSLLQLKDTKKIDIPLSTFGGFYKGNGAYYLVCGEDNKNESDEKEVVRVTKYDTSWSEVGDCSIKGINTYIPFDAGSLRMTETDGKLYIHTCHEMYASSDSLHHQANMTFVISEADMTLLDKYTDVMNLSYGYVSHSFDQFIETDGENIYRVDHGDANPRGIALTVVSKDKKIYEPHIRGTIVKIDGNSGNNFTGLNIGDFKLSADTVMIAYNYNGTGTTDSKVRNIYVACNSKDFDEENPTISQITNYGSDSTISVSKPKLVKITDSHFLLMWAEQNSADDSYVTKLVLIDSYGHMMTDIVSKRIYLSDCEPIVMPDKTVSWYISDGKNVVLYNIDPFELSVISNDVKRDIAVSNPVKGSYVVTTSTGQTKNDKTKTSSLTVNLKASKTYKLSKKVIIKASEGVKLVKINGKRIKIKSGKTKVSFKLKRYKKLLKRGKYNKIRIKSADGANLKVKFKVVW